MATVKGYVTFSGSKLSKKNGKPFGMVNIEGVFMFADVNNLPAKGQEIEAVISVNRGGENQADTVNILSWWPVNRAAAAGPWADQWANNVHNGAGNHYVDPDSVYRNGVVPAGVQPEVE